VLAFPPSLGRPRNPDGRNGTNRTNGTNGTVGIFQYIGRSLALCTAYCGWGLWRTRRRTRRGIPSVAILRLIRNGGYVPVSECKAWAEEWTVESGEWAGESGEWRVESGEWRVASGQGRVDRGTVRICRHFRGQKHGVRSRPKPGQNWTGGTRMQRAHPSFGGVGALRRRGRRSAASLPWNCLKSEMRPNAK